MKTFRLNFFKVESLLSLYLLSGIIKGFLVFNSINTYIDITLLFAILLFFSFAFELIKQNNIKKIFKINYTIIYFILFWIWIFISLFYTSSDNNSITKAIYFGTNLIPVYFILIKYDNFNIRLFLKYFIVLQLILVLLYFPYAFKYYKTWDSKLSDITRMYLSLAENIGLVLLSLYLSREYIFGRIWDKMLLIISFLFLFALSARGPILFVLLIVILNFLIFSKKIHLLISKQVLYVLLFSLISTIFLTIFYWDSLYVVIKNSLFRINIFLDSIFNPSNIHDSSISLRLELLKNAINIIFSDIKTFFIGKGIGSFGIEVYGIDSSIHPHNNIIEVLFELGFIGLILYSFFLISIVNRIKINYKYISYFIILYAILNILKSSSLIDIRILLSFIILHGINSNSNYRITA